MVVNDLLACQYKNAGRAVAFSCTRRSLTVKKFNEVSIGWGSFSVSVEPEL